MAAGSSATGDLRVDVTLTIPEDELEVTFHTTGGPGGQHAARSATGVSLEWDYGASSAIDDGQRARLAAHLGKRGRGGVVRVDAVRSRSQWRNRTRARAQLADLVRSALVVAPSRRPTRPSPAARRRRLERKRRRGELKAQRRPPPHD